MPRNLRHFHELWHESQTGRSRQFFGDQDVDPEITQLLQVVAALRAVRPVTARAEFVSDLRGRLLVAARNSASTSRSAASHPENE